MRKWEDEKKRGAWGVGRGAFDRHVLETWRLELSPVLISVIFLKFYLLKIVKLNYFSSFVSSKGEG